MNHIALFFKDVFLGQKTGRIIWRSPEDQRIFFFQEGVLLYAKSDVPGESLLDILIKQGRLTLEQADQISLQGWNVTSLGEELIQKELIDRDKFFEALMAQAREAVLGAFPGFEAEIVFEETLPISTKGLESTLNLPRLIAEGVRAMPPNPSLLLFFEGKVPVLMGEAFVEYLEDEEKKLLARIDGRRETTILLESSQLDEEFYWRTLFLFFCLGLIDLKPVVPDRTEEARGESAEHLQDLLSEVQVLREALGSIHQHQLLNIPFDADEGEIKKAYFEMARKFHPDAFGRDILPEMRQAIFEVFNSLTRAFQSLTAKARKKAGMAGTGSETSSGTSLDLLAHRQRAEERAQGKDRADLMFRKGQKLYDDGKYGGAAAMFQEAARLDPKSAEYCLWLARSESKVPTLAKKAEKDYLQASRLEPKNPEPLVGLGMLYKKEGFLSLAVKQFEKACEIDPSHPVALRELGTGGDKPERKKGLFGRKR